MILWCQGAQNAKQWVPFAAVEKQNLCAHLPVEPNKWLPTDFQGKISVLLWLHDSVVSLQSKFLVDFDGANLAN